MSASPAVTLPPGLLMMRVTGRALMFQHQHGLNEAVAGHIVDLALQQQHAAVKQLACHIDSGNMAVLGLLDDAGLDYTNGHVIR